MTMEARFAMWVHGVTAYPERTAGEGPLVQVRESVEGPGVAWSDITGFRQGYGATFRGKRNQNNWFHFAIPAPVIMPLFQPSRGHYDLGQPIKLEKVFVLYKSYISGRGGALTRIDQVDVWDGGDARYTARLVPDPHPDDVNRNQEYTDVPPDPELLRYDRYEGDHHLEIQGGWNAWTITDGTRDIKPLIRWGICISVLVHFADEVEIRFAAAGADFVVEVP